MARGLQCLRDGRACCPSLPKQLVICRFLMFHRRRDVVVSSRCLCVLARVVLNFPLNGTCTNVYAHVVMRSEHAWRTVCSVCATGARVAQSFLICRFLRFHRRRSRCCFKLLFHWTGTGWIEFPTEWNLCKRVRARDGGA